MKSIYSEAKQQLSNCMLHDTDDDASSSSTTTTTPLATATAPLASTIALEHQDNKINHHQQYFIAAAATPTLGAHHHNHHRQHHHHAATSRTTTTTTSTYDTLQRPFKYDQRRGRWSSAADFYFACTSHAFGTIIFSELPVYGLMLGGVYFLPAYLIAILLYALPVFAIQTFLGQFSTSGTISAFRVAPIFKGIGYSILLLNLTSLAYYSVIAAVPLIYAINSLHSVIPWMSCNNTWNSANCSVHSSYDEESEFQYPHATVEFFRYIILSTDNFKSDFTISWSILYGVMGIWLLTLAILLKRVTFIGKLFRWTYILMVTFFISIFAHLIMYMKIDWATFVGYFEPILGASQEAILSSIRVPILMATWMLGPGWGSTLNLASHNSFRRDGEKLTYWVSVTHALIALMAMICGRIALDHFEDEVGLFHYHVEENHYMQFLYLCFAYLFGSFTSLPNFWSFLFFAMLFIAEMCALIIQMMTVLTALFDEYEKLRRMKTRITIVLTVIMMLISVCFCTKPGFEHLHILPTIAILTHVIISIVLLLMATWIYGRERFQCDLQFMLGKTISNFKIFLIRFLTPAFLIISITEVLFLLESGGDPGETLSPLAILFQTLVYAVAPAYMIYKVCNTSGTLRNRLKQCLEPHDWHPVDADNRRFYEEVMGISEMLVIDSEQQFINVNA